MKNFLCLFLIIFCSAQLTAEPEDLSRHRLIILADMGNEPDEIHQMIHMITCSNEFEIEGLMAVTGKYMHPNSSLGAYNRVTHPELFIDNIDAYAKVYGNLLKHASGWHAPEALKKVVTRGQTDNGIDDVGMGKEYKNNYTPVWRWRVGIYM